MAQAILSTINLCPINFKAFNDVNKLTESIEATVLYSKLKFHQQNSKIIKSGKQCIARSRDQLAGWFGFGLKKTDKLLALLEKQGLIEKQQGLWYGKKRLFINANQQTPLVPLNIKLLESLIGVTGSVRNAIIYAKIAFAFNNTTITHDNMPWCCIKKSDLAAWANISIRTLDGILDDLTGKGLLLKKNFVRYSKLQMHYHIPSNAIKKLVLQIKLKTLKPSVDQFIAQVKSRANKHNKPVDNHAVKKSASSSFCRKESAKKAASIRLRSNPQQTTNITIVETCSTENIKRQSDIIFEFIGNDLSYRQLKYLESAMNKTVVKRKVKLSNPKDIWEQIKFSILNAEQHKQNRGVRSFKHAVNRCMKILGDNRWQIPFGFNKHSSYGANRHESQENYLKQWEQTKAEETAASRQYQNLTDQLGLSTSQPNTAQLTEKALRLAEQLIRLNDYQGNSEQVQDLISDLTRQIQGLIRQGADVCAVKGILSK